MAKLNNDQIEKKLQSLNGWEYDELVLKKDYQFRDFREAFSKMTAIAFIAEEHQHHPDWKNSYNTLSIHLTSHDAGGVTEKDFNMAQAIDEALSKGEQ